ncbi:multimeric flavodoxin WrbA [Enterococcus sp. PF1-24]|uniref:flavodoxin family protein n=1 Tax=unclassified Enterococcus TaxID=2608891 RepID=UPI002474DCF1|nr:MULTISPECIES: flavodoxin family protein [unclassified Enterococcus]MDH6365324.1 multimeric flavodoxin WrbA [Enterococcus sp. PFB1-1]MDH6402420.1 multimeric flavodoxin WrbA [Enterococcus sp. PF1-24]
MAKIIILNGSPRKKGATAKILRQLAEELSLLGNEIDYYEINELTFKACTGCCYCYRKGPCFIRDDAEAFSLTIEAAEGIIIGSPTYSSNISGQLKTLLDRSHLITEQLLYEKYAISVVTGKNYGNRTASKALNQLLQYAGAQLSGKIICTTPFNHSPLKQPKLKNKISKLAKKFDYDIKQQRKFLFQTIFHAIIFKFGIKPFVLKKSEHNQGIINRWQKNPKLLKK